MKVIVINEFGTPEIFCEEQWDIPRPSADEVLIRVRAGSFNPIDYKIRQGRFGGDLPIVLGHDAAGIIEEVGRNVGHLRVGDEVWVYLGGPCSNGAYAEYVSVPHEFVTIKPRILSFEEAASVPVTGLKPISPSGSKPERLEIIRYLSQAVLADSVRQPSRFCK